VTSAPQGIRGGGFERAGTLAAEFFIEGFETMNEIGEVFARVHAAGGFAEVGAAAKRPVRIDGAAAIAAQQRAGPVRMWLELDAAAGADAFGQVERLTQGEQRGPARESEVAASAAKLAVTW